MIKEFKIFEKKSIKKNLVDQFDSDYIEKWYDENYDIDLSEVINMSSHNQIMDNFDEDKYKKDFLREYADSYDFNDFNEEDLLRYIKEKINEEKEIKILEIYNRNNYDEDDEDSVKETDYEDYILDQLDKDDRLIIMGSGIVILLLINYKKNFEEIFYNKPRINDF